MNKQGARTGRSTGRRAPAGARSSTRPQPSSGFRVDPAFFGRVIESLAEYAVLTLDRNLHVTSSNAAAQRIFGYTAQELHGKPMAILFTPEDRQRGYPGLEFEAARKRGRAQDERYHLGKGGRRFWSYGLSFPLIDGAGAIQGYVKIIRDESERKRSEDLLLERQERLRLAIEATGMGTWDYLPGTQTLELSDSAKALLAWPP